MPNVADLVAAIAKHKGAKFSSFLYTAKESGEVARHTLILGASTEVLYEKDILALEKMLPDMVDGIDKIAVEAILESRKTSLKLGIGNNPAYTCADVYVEPMGLGGIKVHKDNGSLHVCGLVEDKKIITPGVFKVVKSAPLTLAKRAVMKLLPSNRFRQFKLERVTTAKLHGETLELETEL